LFFHGFIPVFLDVCKGTITGCFSAVRDPADGSTFGTITLCFSAVWDSPGRAMLGRSHAVTLRWAVGDSTREGYLQVMENQLIAGFVFAHYKKNACRASCTSMVDIIEDRFKRQ
jgi:hypothetical protein